MPSKSSRQTLEDIHRNIDLAHRFLNGLTWTEFQSDTRTVYAAVRCLEIISEASRRLPAGLKAAYPNIPWQDVASAGSIYRHGYDIVSDDIVWKTIRESLDPLRLMVLEELKKLQSS